MTHQYSIDQAQSHLDEIINTVESGPPVELVREGQRIAVLISSEEYDRLTSSQKPDFWQALNTFRQQFSIEALNFDTEVFEDLRDNSPGREVIL